MRELLLKVHEYLQSLPLVLRLRKLPQSIIRFLLRKSLLQFEFFIFSKNFNKKCITIFGTLQRICFLQCLLMVMYENFAVKLITYTHFLNSYSADLFILNKKIEVRKLLLRILNFSYHKSITFNQWPVNKVEQFRSLFQLQVKAI